MKPVTASGPAAAASPASAASAASESPDAACIVVQTPLIFLASLLALTALAALAHRLLRRRHRKRLRRLAADCGMQYVPLDLFDLPRRIGRAFPVPGAADLHVQDVIYATHGQRHRYVFTAEYTVGVTDQHHRVAQVMTFCEPVEGASPSNRSPLAAAPQYLSLLEQYQYLRREWDPSCQ
jgi:hypothetical protein